MSGPSVRSKWEGRNHTKYLQWRELVTQAMEELRWGGEPKRSTVSPRWVTHVLPSSRQSSWHGTSTCKGPEAGRRWCGGRDRRAGALIMKGGWHERGQEGWPEARL